MSELFRKAQTGSYNITILSVTTSSYIQLVFNMKKLFTIPKMTILYLDLGENYLIRKSLLGNLKSHPGGEFSL